mmetsp:Transcript_31679/g.71251  ORF Transcript_31679/g.71251 Transcript_31679/m.71251 type:complete len:250 (-) Transcript_31679:175-924(-)
MAAACNRDFKTSVRQGPAVLLRKRKGSNTSMLCTKERIESLDQGRSRLGCSSTSWTQALTAPLSAIKLVTDLKFSLPARTKHLDSRSATRQTVPSSSASRSFVRAMMEGRRSRRSRVASKFARAADEPDSWELSSMLERRSASLSFLCFLALSDVSPTLRIPSDSHTLSGMPASAVALLAPMSLAEASACSSDSILLAASSVASSSLLITCCTAGSRKMCWSPVSRSSPFRLIPTSCDAGASLAGGLVP